MRERKIDRSMQGEEGSSFLAGKNLSIPSSSEGFGIQIKCDICFGIAKYIIRKPNWERANEIQIGNWVDEYIEEYIKRNPHEEKSAMFMKALAYGKQLYLCENCYTWEIIFEEELYVVDTIEI
jgi:hypothetical protein